MNNLFVQVLLGHFVADYLLQSRDMAMRKSDKNWRGFAWCMAHCIIYTLTVCSFLQTLDLTLMLLVFLSHFPIDRWSLASKWLKVIKGRDILEAYQSKEKYREIDIAFSCLVYAIADNTIHLVLLYWITLIV